MVSTEAPETAVLLMADHRNKLGVVLYGGTKKEAERVGLVCI